MTLILKENFDSLFLAMDCALEPMVLEKTELIVNDV